MRADALPGSPSMAAQEVIDLLGLERHPEGGWFGETFRDPEPANGRAHSTAIYYLLAEGEISAWHRVDAVEVWHAYGGAPLAISIAAETGPAERHLLGMDLNAGQRPQVIVPRHHWQSAQSLGAWTLVGCTVAPGFEFAGFEMAPEGWEPA